MTSQPKGSDPPAVPVREPSRPFAVGLRSMGQPNSVARAFDFWNDRYEGRRPFSEVLGTFFLVLAAVGGGMVNARFGGQAVPYDARAVAPALTVAAVILFMGSVSGAHLNPAVSLAFALRRDFPWKRVPAYIAAQFLGAILATLLLWALIGRQGSAGLTVPGPGVSATTCAGDGRRDRLVGVPGRRGHRRGHRPRAQGGRRRPERNPGRDGNAGYALASGPHRSGAARTPSVRRASRSSGRCGSRPRCERRCGRRQRIMPNDLASSLPSDPVVHLTPGIRGHGLPLAAHRGPGDARSWR